MSTATLETRNKIGGILAGMSRELRCSVCLFTLNEATTTFCGHTFCKNCIQPQVIEKFCCPTCNAPLSTTQLNPAESLQGIVGQFMQMKEEFERANGVELSTMKISNLPQAQNQEKTTETHVDAEENLPPYRILQLNRNPITHIDIPGARLEKKISSNVTHVVVDTVNHNLVKNSHMYRMAVLFGCYIIGDTWLKISVEQGHMGPEQRFEIYGDETYGRTGAPSKARLRRESNKSNNLFKKLKVNLIDDDHDEYREYLTLGRGEIGDFSDSVVCNLDCDIEDLKKKHPGKVLISCKWIEDSVCRFELEDKDKYIL